jgi:hypothetical protein
MGKTLEIKDFKIKIKMGFIPVILLLLDIIYESGSVKGSSMTGLIFGLFF